MIYHLLNEPFSSIRGLAIARIVADIVQLDQNSMVVCPDADLTWEVPQEQILILPATRILSVNSKGASMRGWRLMPSPVRRMLITRIFSGLLGRLQKDDVVWCHNWPYVGEALAGAVRAKSGKLIFHAHNSLTPYASRRLFRSFKPDAYVFISEAMRQEALRLMPHLERTYAVHNGTNEESFYPANSRQGRERTVPVILYVGRLTAAKGVHVLVEAMRILHERKVQTHCKVVGSSHAGGDRVRTTDYIKTLHENCPPNVSFLGFRSAKNIAQEYRDADVFCCPSIWQEPFGLVNVEAMACGVPVVASRVGGIPEIASDGGFVLVKPDSPVELADALQELIQDQSLRRMIGVEGVNAYRKRFTSSGAVQRYLNIVSELNRG